MMIPIEGILKKNNENGWFWALEAEDEVLAVKKFQIGDKSQVRKVF